MPAPTQNTNSPTDTATLIKKSPYTLVLRYLDNDANKSHEIAWIKTAEDLRAYQVQRVGKVQVIQSVDSLGNVPTNTLLAVFNAHRKQVGEPALDRFRDRATAEVRVFDVLPNLAVSFVPVTATEATMSKKAEKPVLTDEQKAAAAASRAEDKQKREDAKKAEKEANKAAKGPGVIGTIKELLESDEGTTVEEALQVLVGRFPDRTADGMRSTVKIQFSRLAVSTGRKIENDQIEGRGRVYKFADKGPIPGNRVVKAAPATEAAATSGDDTAPLTGKKAGKAPKAEKAAATA